MPPGDLPGQLALDGKHPPEVLIRVRERDTGATRWSLVHAFPIAGAPGEVLYAVNLFRDVTDRTDAARRLRFLADASGVLASSLDYEEILVQIARLAVPTIADWCIVWVVDDDGELRTLTFGTGYSEQVRMAEETSGGYPPGGRVVEQVIDSGKPLVVPEITDAFLVESARHEEHLALLRDADLRSFLALLLAGRDHVYGALGLLTVRGSPRFDEGDLELAADLGRRAAAAIETALLLQRTEETAERAGLQNEVGRVLSEATDEATAVDRILESVCRALDWDVGQLWRFDADGVTLRHPGLRRPGGRDRGVRACLPRTRRRPGDGTPGPGLGGRRARLGSRCPRGSALRARSVRRPGFTARWRSRCSLPERSSGWWSSSAAKLRVPEPPLAATLSAIGSQLGLFLARVQAEQAREQLLGSERTARAAAEEAARMLSKLEGVTQAALRHVVSGDVLDEMLRQITRLLDSDTSAILLLDEEGKFLTVRAALGFDREIDHAVPIPFGEGMAGRVAASATPVVIRDLARVELASPHLRERGIKLLVAIPIMVGEQVIGVAHAGSIETGHFEEVDMRLLRLMADRIALAITQSQAYEDERRARHEAELAHRRLASPAEASTLLATSLDYESTLGAVARLAVPHLADWCVVDVAVDSSRLERIAVAHIDPDKIGLVTELQRRFPSQETDPIGPYAVLRSGTPELAPAIPEESVQATHDDEHLQVVRDLGIRSYMCVPMWGRGPCPRRSHFRDRRVAAQSTAPPTWSWRRSWLAARRSRSTTRGSTGEVTHRAQAARGARLRGRRDPARRPRRNRPALERDRRDDHRACGGRGRRAARAGGDPELVVVRASWRWPRTRRQSPPGRVTLDLGEREPGSRWSASSSTRAASSRSATSRPSARSKKLKTDFVSTVSHELRTPLAGVYGAAMTLRRATSSSTRSSGQVLLDVISARGRAPRARSWRTSSPRGSSTRTSLTLAVRELRRRRSSPPRCRCGARAPAAERRAIDLEPPAGRRGWRPTPRGEPGARQPARQRGQVLVRRRPDGGDDRVANGPTCASPCSTRASASRRREQRRSSTSSSGSTRTLPAASAAPGLGLYICRELVHRMNGRLWVVSPRADGKGSTFAFELPAAQQAGAT